MADITRWEYLAVRNVRTGVFRGNFACVKQGARTVNIDALGKAGWELACVWDGVYYFKRPLD